MAFWVLETAPWAHIPRLRIGLDALAIPYRLPSSVLSKTFFSSPPLGMETPAMIDIRNQPYPTSGLDAAVFEDETEDYGYRPLQTETTEWSPGPWRHLIRLVTENNFADAARVRDELKEMGIRIWPNKVYTAAAFHSWAGSEAADEDKMVDFMSWWSLLPHYSRRPWASPQLNTLHKLLNLDLVPNIPLVVRCSLMAASLGYESRISDMIVPIIVRHAQPDLTLGFLEKYKAKDLQFREDVGRHQQRHGHARTSLIREAHSTRFSKLYALALRTQCLAGRLPAAVDLFSSALRLQLEIPRFSVKFLLTSLRRAGYEDLATLVESWGFSPPGIVKPPEELVGVYGTPLLRPPPVNAIRGLQSLIDSRDRPSAAAFHYIIKLYDVEDDPEALSILRTTLFSHRSSAAVRMSWLAAEMRSLTLHSRLDEVLILFARHFWGAGVPVWALKRIAELSRRELERDTTLQPPTQRIWPSADHTAHIWQLAITQATTFQDLEQLYAEYRKIATIRVREGSGLHQTMPLQDGRFMDEEARAPPALFKSLHFDLFIDAFAEMGGILRAAQIPDHMTRLDLPISRSSFCALVRGFMTMKTSRCVANIMHKFSVPYKRKRSGRDRSRRSIKVNRCTLEVGPDTLVKLPHPVIVAYLAAIVRFLHEDKHEHAAAIKESLEETHGELNVDLAALLSLYHESLDD